MLAPADKRAVAVALDKIGSFLDTFGLMRRTAASEEQADALRFYADALKTLPSDLAMLAVDRVCRSHSYQSPILPGDLLKAVAEELAARSHTLRRLELAQKLAKRDEPVDRGRPLSPERQAELERILAEVKSGAGLRLVPKYPTDTQRPTGHAGAEIATFRLPDDSDPAVQQTLRDMGTAE